MITMRAVVEAPAVEAPPWPVAATAAWSTLDLGPGCTDAQVGLFVAGLVDRPGGGADEVVDAVLGAEMLIAAGGLSVGDSRTGTVLAPGCCAGLENWRDWEGLARSSTSTRTPTRSPAPGPRYACLRRRRAGCGSPTTVTACGPSRRRSDVRRRGRRRSS
ncbi:hypothetical protein [Dactylosporangium sp. NPDC050588]|uniref:hypothetical protein n=1 Tax=Dactylosporangium sp. NPDC050588 TaxID=3157211 RepID=UPI0033D4DABB